MAKNEEKNVQLTKAEKKQAKFDAKKQKANDKKKELATQIDELKAQILAESDEKKKAKLRKQKDALVAQREGITRSKDGMTIPMPQNTKNAIRAAIAVVLVIAIIACYVATGAVRHGLLSYFGVPQSTVTAFVMEDGDGNKHSIKVDTYNYYFAMQYNNIQSTQSTYSQYGLDLDSMNLNVDFSKKFSKQTTKNDDGKEVTWAEFMVEEVTESIKSTYLYYYEAVKANDGKEPEIKEDQQKEIDEALDSYKESANKYGYTLSGYLTAAMGKGVNEKLFRQEAKIAYIAENYQKEYSDELSKKEYEQADYDNYKKENKDDLVNVDIRYFECDSEDDAKAFVKELKADASNFAELASKYTEDKFDKEALKNDVETTYVAMTRPVLKNIGAAIAKADEKKNEDDEDKFSGLDWIFSKDRKAGDVKQQSTSIVYIVKPAYTTDLTPVTVRHILIAPEADEDDKDAETDVKKMSAKQWEAAEKKAKDILAEYKKGKMTAEAFGELAKENSTDGNASEGGIYENVTPNQMVPTFNAWCFNEGRQAGDTGIVKTEFGYHIIYFEDKNDMPVWQYTAQQALAAEDGNDTIDKLEKSYSIKSKWFGSRYFENDTDIDAGRS